MAVIDWPEGVPNCILPTSPQGGLRDTRNSFETDSKISSIERPLASWAPAVYAVEMSPMSLAQFAAFEAWYAGPLAYGVNAFSWVHPITGAAGVWKILKADPPYQVRKVGLIPAGSDRRRISVSFSVVSQPGGV